MTTKLLKKTFTKSLGKIQRFLKREDGPTAVEYAVMLALIVMVCVGAIQSVGSQTSSAFMSAANGLSTSSAS
jgi:pilus assembly protein Flp/PilA